MHQDGADGRGNLLPAWKIRRVEELLAERVPQRRIAAQIGVGRSTVGRVAQGRINSRRRQADDDLRTTASPESAISPTRCPRCGGICTEAPCRRCLTATLVQSGAIPASHTPEELPVVGLELNTADRRRYEEVRVPPPECKEPDRAA